MAVQGTVRRLRHQDRRLPAGTHLPLRGPGDVPMSSDLARFEPPRRLPRPVRQAVAQTEATALVAARGVQSKQFVTEVGMFAVAGLTKTQKDLTELVPEAALRLAAIADAGTSAIAADIIRMAL